jgi:hypothetical protein
MKHGHTFLYGVITAIGAEKGKVIDVQIITSTVESVHRGRKDRRKEKEWQEHYAKNCKQQTTIHFPMEKGMLITN